MMRRRGRRRGAEFANLDSFLDIVTNVLGAMFFVVVYVALSAFSATGRLKTPMVDLSSGSSPVFFECRNGTVFFPDYMGLVDRSNRIWTTAQKQGVDWDGRVKRLQDADVRNDYCKYVAEVQRDIFVSRVVDTLEPIPGAVGEGMAEVARAQSAFRRKLKELDAKKTHVYFIVRPDSYDIFRAARGVAGDMGYGSGWEPWEQNEPIRFSGGGSAGIVPGRQ